MERVRVKLCGMTRRQDIEHAIHLGVDAIGLIFYPQSPRCISLQQAENLLINLPPFVSAVAVLVNPEPSFVTEIIRNLPIDLLQFHGDERSEDCISYGKQVIKAFQVNQNPPDPHSYRSVGALLLDASHPNLYGGTGKTFDWNLANSFKKFLNAMSFFRGRKLVRPVIHSPDFV